MQSEAVSVWSKCIQVIKENVADQSFRTWFAPIVPLRLEGQTLTIQVPSQFFYEWLEEHYVNLLRKAIVSQLGDNGQLEYSIIVDKGNNVAKPYTINLPTSKTASGMPDDNVKNHQKPYMDENANRPVDHSFLSNTLNPAYSFDNFIEGDCNMLARSAGVAVANKPGVSSFNPLMIYGGVGLGKTHLVQAIGNHVKKSRADLKVVYVSLDKFTNQFIDSLKNHNIEAFYKHYLSVDVLIIDDIHYLANREKTQDMFFNVFNELHQSKKQIILTSDRPPKELAGIDERLLSRFKWGLTADVKQPDFETRLAIIDKKMEAEGIEIPPKVAEYIAYTLDNNVRELEGVLISLIAHSSINKREIDLELAKEVLQHVVSEIDNEVGIDYIQKVVSDYFRVPQELLKAKTRKKEVVMARQVAMYFSKEYTTHSLKTIGFYFGGRDHSTVIHAINTVEDLMQVDKRTRAQVQELEKRFKGKAIEVNP